MRRSCVPVLVLLTAFGVEARAQSVPNCGTVSVDSHIWQAGYNRYLWADFETVSQMTGCATEVQAEGWIVGVDGADYARQPHYAYLRIGRPVPYYGRWESWGKHWLIHFGGASWEFRGETHRQVDMIVPTGGGGGGAGEMCTENKGDYSRAGNGCESPILVDMAGDGFKLTSVRNGVSFDLDADGLPERIAWTRADSDDAWLALDRNGNGIIDDGSELFGNHTPAYADRADPVAQNGFVALRFAEGPSYGGPSLTDDRIDARDVVFRKLLLWTDRNHNGFSEPDELQYVAATHLAAIGTEFRESPRRDRYGNQFRLRAKSWWTDGSMHPVFDVWLLTQDITDSDSDDEAEARE